MDLDINTGPKPKPGGVAAPQPDYQRNFDGCAFSLVRGLLALIASVSGLGILLAPFQPTSSLTPPPVVDLTGPTLSVCFTLALVGLAVCYRPHDR